MNTKKVLLTGATGFIGRYCLEKLLQTGYKVYAVYRKEKQMVYGNVHWIQGDLLEDQCAIKKVLDNNDVPYLLHLAWDVTPGQYQNSDSNLEWLKSSLDLIKMFVQAGGKRIVTAGTCFEYDFSHGILKEDETPLKPDTLYGECKAAMFKVAGHYCQLQNVSYAHGRVFYLYGPGEDERRVVPYVMKELLEGSSPKCSSGVQELDYLYVKDVAKAFVQILELDVQGAVNIGSGERRTLRELLETVYGVVGRDDVEVQFAKAKPEDQKRVIADAAKLRTRVGWEPDYTIEDGVAEFVKWMGREK